LCANSKRKYKSFKLGFNRENLFTVDQFKAASRWSESTINRIDLEIQEREFQMSFLEFRDFVNFKNLHTLKIAFPGYPFIRDTSFGDETIEMKALKKLDIHFRTTSGLNDPPAFRYTIGVKFLNHIKTPNLENFSIDFKAHFPDRNIPIVLDFLTNNSLGLKEASVSFLNTEYFYWNQKCLRINCYETDVGFTKFLFGKTQRLENFHLLNSYDLNLIKMVMANGQNIKHFSTNVDLGHLLDDMSFRQIKKLTLMRSHFQMESLLNLARNFPNLEELCFCFSTLDQNLKDQLTQIFPNLKNVSLCNDLFLV
jgi:hypothetical protein